VVEPKKGKYVLLLSTIEEGTLSKENPKIESFNQKFSNYVPDGVTPEE
jgi:hypothetical protein